MQSGPFISSSRAIVSCDFLSIPPHILAGDKCKFGSTSTLLFLEVKLLLEFLGLISSLGRISVCSLFELVAIPQTSFANWGSSHGIYI